MMDKDLNDAGRGINVVVIDTKTLKFKEAQRYDTYEKGMLYLSIDSEVICLSVWSQSD